MMLSQSQCARAAGHRPTRSHVWHSGRRPACVARSIGSSIDTMGNVSSQHYFTLLHDPRENQLVAENLLRQVKLKYWTHANCAFGKWCSNDLGRETSTWAPTRCLISPRKLRRLHATDLDLLEKADEYHKTGSPARCCQIHYFVFRMHINPSIQGRGDKRMTTHPANTFIVQTTFPSNRNYNPKPRLLALPLTDSAHNSLSQQQSRAWSCPAL